MLNECQKNEKIQACKPNDRNIIKNYVAFKVAMDIKLILCRKW
jgi:hypothetical protein